jgi:hypothetical protein
MVVGKGQFFGDYCRCSIRCCDLLQGRLFVVVVVVVNIFGAFNGGLLYIMLIFAALMCRKCYIILVTRRTFLHIYRKILQNNIVFLKILNKYKKVLHSEFFAAMIGDHPCMGSQTGRFLGLSIPLYLS